MALSSNGTILARAPFATPGVFTDISEVGDMPLIELFRNTFDASTQNKGIDSRVLGILRRSPAMVPLNYMPTDATQSEVSGLYAALKTNSIDGYKFYQTASSLIWIASGQVSKITPKAPVDGKLGIDVTFEFSGPMYLDGVLLS